MLSHALQSADLILLIGDSVVDMPQLCGGSVLNANVAGARTATIDALSHDVLAVYHPKLVIVAVGLNDAHDNAAIDDGEFLSE